MFSRVFGSGAFLKLPVLGAVRLFLSSVHWSFGLQNKGLLGFRRWPQSLALHAHTCFHGNMSTFLCECHNQGRDSYSRSSWHLVILLLRTSVCDLKSLLSISTPHFWHLFVINILWPLESDWLSQFRFYLSCFSCTIQWIIMLFSIILLFYEEFIQMIIVDKSNLLVFYGYDCCNITAISSIIVVTELLLLQATCRQFDYYHTYKQRWNPSW